MNWEKELNDTFFSRRTDAEKQRFTARVVRRAGELGYPARTVTQRKGNEKNLVIGSPQKASYLITAQLESPAWSPFPNWQMPGNPVSFLLYALVQVLILLALSLVPALLLQLAGVGGVWPALLWIGLFIALLFVCYRALPDRRAHPAADAGLLTALTLMETLPPEKRSAFSFVLFDRSDQNLAGGRGWINTHPEEAARLMVLQLDQVTGGRQLMAMYRRHAPRHPLFGEVCEALSRHGVSVKRLHGGVNRGEDALFPFSLRLTAADPVSVLGPVTRVKTLTPENIGTLCTVLSALPVPQPQEPPENDEQKEQ